MFREDSAFAEPQGPAPVVRRSVTVGWVLLAIGVVLVLILGLTPAPYVIEMPGPVFNTLASDQPVGDSGKATGAEQTEKAVPLISIPGQKTYPTSGSLDMLTVASVGRPGALPSWMQVVGAWFEPSKAVIPVDVAYPPSSTVKEQDAENTALMLNSQKDAVAAALNQLGTTFPQAVSVKQVLKGTPASGRLEVGDEIVTVNGTKVGGVASLRSLVAKSGAGRTAEIGVLRHGKSKTVEVTPVTRDGSVVLGVGVGMDYTFPFEVRIQLDKVGGPSAGMMFALGIIDKLTPGTLNGGKSVAGTGTIDNEGNVGPIGGIRQKMFAARDAGADYFLAPASDCGDVVGHVPDGLRVFSVKTLGDSLDVMKALRTSGDLDKLPRCHA
ncbi:PDZ domain-containing protein [Microbacterium sp. STN6]|nr:PDZ domain-containing protein [Microbacterium sp. STN6]